MYRPTRLKVPDLNQHLTCVICNGYLIDATTIVECLHSFCRTCIVQYLKTNEFCPVCEVLVHEAKPLLSIKSDVILQDIVYKLIPDLYENEMHRRREFYRDHPEAAGKEERVRGAEQRCFYSPQEIISVVMKNMHGSKESNNAVEEESSKKDSTTRYLNCPAATTVAALKKFVRNKFEVVPSYSIELLYEDNLLFDEYTLMDIAYIFMWRRAGPMTFIYSITDSHSRKYDIPKVMPVAKDELTVLPSVPITEDSINCDTVSESKDSEKMEIDDPNNNTATFDTDIVCNRVDVKDNAVAEPVTTHPVTKDLPMDITETEVSNPSSEVSNSESAPVTCKTESLQQNVPVVSAPQHAVIPTANSLKLKIIQCPDPKSRSKKSGGKKGGRGSRNKNVPILRFPRLAPYPPPGTAVPTQCLTPSNITPISQIAGLKIASSDIVGKLVPNMITSPSLMTALVSTTANNSLCSSSSTLQPSASFVGQVTTCNVVTCNVTTFSNSFSPSLSNNLPRRICNETISNTKSTTSVSNSNFSINTIPNSHVITVQSPVSIVNSTLPTIEVTSTVNINPALSHSPITTVPLSQQIPMTTVPQILTTVCNSSQAKSMPLSCAPSLPVISVLSNSSVSNKTIKQTITNSVSPNTSDNSIYNSKQPESSEKESSHSPKILPSSDKTSDAKEVGKTDEMRVVTNGIPSDELSSDKTSIGELEETPKNTILNKNNMNCSPPIEKLPNTLDKDIKITTAAELSDNDDLGCPADLVVDEELRMDISDNEDESDLALREKISAIAEKEDDDTEADSGRASDVSNQARSSCDDDIGSPNPAFSSHMDKKTAVTVAATVNTCLPSFTLPVSSSVSVLPVSSNTITESSRSAKSNKIDHVINNIYRNHEKKDSIGALDLSSSEKKQGEPTGIRPKPVANPVLDIKHKQPVYLGAASKQHTACVPAPKPNTPSLLMQGLTARHPILPSQLHGKTPHIPVLPFHTTPMVYSSQSRAVSTSSCTSGRSTPTYNVSRTGSSPMAGAHLALSPMLAGLHPGMNNSLMNSYQIRSSALLTSRSPTHLKGISSSPAGSPLSKSPSPHQSKQLHSRKSSLDSHHAKSPTTPNNRNGTLGVVTPGTQASYPKTSPSSLRISPHHRSASPAPSPKPPSTSSYKSSTPSIPIYKKSNSYKSYNSSKFKGSNLAVFNPDPNSYKQKIVIRNISSDGDSDIKTNNNHHHSPQKG